MPSCKVPGHGPLTDNMVAMGYFAMPGNSLQLGETSNSVLDMQIRYSHCCITRRACSNNSLNSRAYLLHAGTYNVRDCSPMNSIYRQPPSALRFFYLQHVAFVWLWHLKPQSVAFGKGGVNLVVGKRISLVMCFLGQYFLQTLAPVVLLFIWILCA
jgi:hypothetical protein